MHAIVSDTPGRSMQPSSSRARSRSWGSGPWTTTTPPLSPRRTKPRHERSRSATSTYYAPLVSQAAEDASAAAEAVEVAGSESAGLREAVAERERAVEDLRRDNEALRASEAAARDRAEELQGQLDAAARKVEREVPLVEKWRREDDDAQRQGKLGAAAAAAFLDTGRLVPGGRKGRMFASLSNLAELKSAAAAMDDYGYEFDHLDVAGQYADDDDATEHAIKHKIKSRRSILCKFGDLFRRRSLYKRNLAPVLHNHY